VNQLSTRLGANQDTSLPFVGENVPEVIELLGPTGPRGSALQTEPN
jgi:uncharacterized protein YidB (DUF937 family)